MKEYLKRIFLVHKCVGCRKILDYKHFDEAFCPSCRERYLGARMQICSECALEAEKCRCVPALLKKDKILSLRRLFFYSKSRSGEVQNRLIYYLKRNKSRRVSRALARDLLPMIYAELAKFEIDELPLVVAIPRSRGSLNEYGFDQADVLARAIAEQSTLEYCAVLKRRRGGRAQKRLTAGERRKNIKNALYADKSQIDRIKGKTVILIDDVVTTGASMSACVHILRECGAKNVICIALASNIKT